MIYISRKKGESRINGEYYFIHVFYYYVGTLEIRKDQGVCGGGFVG